MKRLMKGLVFAITSTFTIAANAGTKVWIVIGDSISHTTPEGTSGQLWLNLVSQERDVVFRSISAPASSLGAKGVGGFNNESTTTTISQIGGLGSNYDGVLIQALTNDYGFSVPPQETQESLRRIMAQQRSAGKKVLMLEAIWRNGENTPNNIGKTLNDYRYAAAVVCNFEYPDVCRFAHKENTIMGTSAGAVYYWIEEVRGFRQLHPNVAGNRYMADWVKAEAAQYGLF